MPPLYLSPFLSDLKRVEENEDGDITYVLTQTWDGYDQHGNWTVHTLIQSSRTEDGDDPQSKSVMRRSITYREAANKRTRR